MKKFVLLSTIVFLSLAVILSGCAKKPEAELQKAESSLQAAKDAGAADYASQDYQAAENKLDEGKKLVDKMKYKDAKAAFEDAASLADTAKDKALAAKKPKTTTMVAPPAPAPAPAPTPAPTPAPEKPSFSDHPVAKGECLWKIASEKSVYGDAYQWPLIYDANKDQIKNPNQIYPKQVLKIPLSPTDTEVQAAREKAGAKVKKAAMKKEATTEKKEAMPEKKMEKKPVKKTMKKTETKKEMAPGSTVEPKK
jgi:LysM repeat protein